MICTVRTKRSRKNIKFRRAAASSLAALLDAFPECCVYDLVGPTLLDLSGISARPPQAHAPTTTGGAVIGGGGGDGGAKGDPIMQARAVACLAAAWPRVPSSSPPSGASSASFPPAEAEKSGAAAAAAAANDAVCKLQRAHAASLTRALSGALSRVVWSVRVPIYGALSAVVSRTATTTTTSESFSPVLTGSVLADVVQAVELGAEDAKYSQVCACVCVPSTSILTSTL